ncbi:MAG: hypothetical protein IKU30_01105 [Clostridia bacterium]|nr:hypothetical protein [Clostridia bacterium]
MKIDYENYTTLQGFMRKALNLKGNELIVYAVIYGYSQIEGQYYNKDLQYLADWCGITVQGVLKVLKRLVNMGLIERRNADSNNCIKRIYYRATKKPTLQFDLATQKFTPVVETDSPIKQSLTPIKQSLIEGQNLPPTTKTEETTKYRGKDIYINNQPIEDTDIEVNKESKMKPTMECNSVLSLSKSKSFIGGMGGAFLKSESLTGQDDLDRLFEEFWAAYPRKVNKKGCRSLFKRIPHIKKRFPDIMAALQEQKKSRQWRFVEFIPHPHTWLNQERWETTEASDKDIDDLVNEVWKDD